MTYTWSIDFYGCGFHVSVTNEKKTQMFPLLHFMIVWGETKNKAQTVARLISQNSILQAHVQNSGRQVFLEVETTY